MEAFFVRQVETPVLYARGANTSTSDDFRAVRQIANSFARHKFTTNAFPQHQNFGTETGGLLARTLRQFGAADPCRETQVVLDLGTGAGLSAHREALNHNRFQTLRGAIDSRAE